MDLPQVGKDDKESNRALNKVSSRIVMRHESASQTDLYALLMEAEKKASNGTTSQSNNANSSKQSRSNSKSVSIKEVTDNLEAGIQLRSKAALSFERNENSKAYENLKEACEKFQAACDGAPNLHFARYHLALTLFDRLKQEMNKTEVEKVMNQCLSEVEIATKIKVNDANTWCLWGMALLEKAKKTQKQNNVVDSEALLMLAGEKLLKCFEITPEHPTAYISLLDCQSMVANWTKERNRQGLAIYHIAGQLYKEGGSYKSWKSRWFVVDDSSISYYKDKQDWIEGPVVGAPAHPQGSIYFSDVLDITKHDEIAKCVGLPEKNRPKSVAPFCLHILTISRTFNILGFNSALDNQRWHDVLKVALRFYNVKKNVKKLLKNKRDSVEFLPADKLARVLEVEMDKNKIEQELIESPESQTNDMKRSTRYAKPSSSFAVQRPPSAISITDEPVLSFEDFKEKLEEMNEEEVARLAKSLIRQYKDEGTLSKLLWALIENNPKAFIQNVADITDFKIAKFGGFERIQKIMAKHANKEKSKKSAEP